MGERMRKRASQRYRHVANGGGQLPLSRQRARSNGVAGDSHGNVVAIHEYSNYRIDRSGCAAQSLHVLEAENAELRNTAIELAIEIQKLRAAQ
jgi:hypothetical protein